MKHLHCRSSQSFVPGHRFVFMAETPEQLKDVVALRDKNKEKDEGLSTDQIKQAVGKADAAIKTLEAQLKKNRESQKMVPAEELKVKDDAKIKTLRDELKRVEIDLNTRLKDLEKIRDSKSKEAFTKALKDAGKSAEDFEKFLAEQKIDDTADDELTIRRELWGYFSAMSRMGKAKEAFDAMKTAYEKGGTSIDDKITQKSLSASTGLTVNATEFTFMDSVTINQAERSKYAYYLGTLMQAAATKWGKDSPTHKAYNKYLYEQFMEEGSALRKKLQDNTKKYREKSDNALLEKEFKYMLMELKTPAEWETTQKTSASVPAPKPQPGPAPQPPKPETTPNKTTSPFDFPDPAEKMKPLKMRSGYAMKVQTYVNHWNVLFGEGQTDGTYKKSQWESIPSKVMELNPDGTFKNTVTKEDIALYSEKMRQATRDAYARNIQAYLADWDLAVGKDAKDPKNFTKEDWEKTLARETARTSYPDAYVTDAASLVQFMSEQRAKVTPEAREAARQAEEAERAAAEKEAREDYANRLDAYIERIKLCAELSTRPEAFDPLIQRAEEQKTYAINQQDGKYTGTFNPNLAPTYLSHRRAEGQRFLLSAKKVLDGFNTQYTSSPELTKALTDQSKELSELAAQDFETIDLVRLQKALARYRTQINSVRAFQGRDSLEKEREDLKKFPDSADETKARAAAYDRGLPFLNKQQALDRGLLIPHPIEAGKHAPPEGFTWVDSGEPLNCAVKLLDESDTAPEGIARKTAESKGLEFKNRRQALKEGLVRVSPKPEDKGKLIPAEGSTWVDPTDPLNMAVKPKTEKDKEAPDGKGKGGSGKGGKGNGEKGGDKDKGGEKKGEKSPEKKDIFDNNPTTIWEKFDGTPYEKEFKALPEAAQKELLRNIKDALEEPKKGLVAIKFYGEDFHIWKKGNKVIWTTDKEGKHRVDNLSITLLKLAQKQFKKPEERKEEVKKSVEFPNKDTTAVWGGFAEDSVMQEKYNTLPEAFQKRFKEGLNVMNSTYMKLERAGKISTIPEEVTIDGVKFYAWLKNQDPKHPDEHSAWSLDPKGEKVIKNMNTWLLMRLQEQAKTAATTTEIKADVPAGELDEIQKENEGKLRVDLRRFKDEVTHAKDRVLDGEDYVLFYTYPMTTSAQKDFMKEGYSVKKDDDGNVSYWIGKEQIATEKAFIKRADAKLRKSYGLPN